MRVVDVSIVTANYNNERFLADFFKSIEESTYCPKEIIFVDDCSTDGSLKFVESIKDDSLKVVSLQSNVGFANALNVGVTHASGKYILRIDPDDFMSPERIERQFEFLEKSPEIDVVGSNCYLFNDRLGRIIGETNLKETHEEIYQVMKKGGYGIGHGTIMCKSWVLKENEFLQENCPAEEYDIFSRMLLKGIKYYNIQECLLYYRIHGNSVSNKTPLLTIKKLAALNEEYFGYRKSQLRVLMQFLFLRNYRLYLFHYGRLRGYLHLIFSILFNPLALLNRLRKFL